VKGFFECPLYTESGRSNVTVELRAAADRRNPMLERFVRLNHITYLTQQEIYHFYLALSGRYETILHHL